MSTEDLALYGRPDVLKKAVSSMVSVPWVMTIPSVVEPSAHRTALANLAI